MSEGVQFCGHEKSVRFQGKKNLTCCYFLCQLTSNSKFVNSQKYSGHFGGAYQEYRMEKQRFPILRKPIYFVKDMYKVDLRIVFLVHVS